MIHIQDEVRYYYRDVIVPKHRNDLELKDNFAIFNPNSDDGNYYILIFNRYQLLDLIKEYKNHSLRFTYKYSCKGNLAWVLDHFTESNGNQVKIIYDYTRSKQRVLEKRFYNAQYNLLKKELYNDEMLKSIYYYRERQVYYVEHFNPSGELLKSIYYHENGLLVK